MHGNCMIVQSGGPTAVINNSLIGILDGVSRTLFNGEIYGAVGGIHGILNEKFTRLTNLSISDRNRLRWTPGSALGTKRFGKLSETDIDKIMDTLKKYDIHYFFYIGGNGSMKLASMIQDYADKVGYELIVIGIPMTIDNDVYGTDHSPGFGSAAKFLATSVIDVDMDMGSYPDSNKITIIETMGRNSGWLAGACSLSEDFLTGSSQLLIYIPEVEFQYEQCFKKLEEAKKEKRNTILVVSEGIREESGELIQRNVDYDFFGRPKLGGVSSYLKGIIEENTGLKARYMDFSVWQRSSMTLASKTDVEEAYHLGVHAVRYVNLDRKGIMVGMVRDLHDEDYHVNYDAFPFEETIENEKVIPKEWYDQNENRMTNDFKDYAFPIIKGEIVLPMDKGLPIYQTVI